MSCCILLSSRFNTYTSKTQKKQASGDALNFSLLLTNWMRYLEHVLPTKRTYNNSPCRAACFAFSGGSHFFLVGKERHDSFHLVTVRRTWNDGHSVAPTRPCVKTREYSQVASGAHPLLKHIGWCARGLFSLIRASADQTNAGFMCVVGAWRLTNCDAEKFNSGLVPCFHCFHPMRWQTDTSFSLWRAQPPLAFSSSNVCCAWDLRHRAKKHREQHFWLSSETGEIGLTRKLPHFGATVEFFTLH
jgi:hypothetical protein